VLCSWFSDREAVAIATQGGTRLLSQPFGQWLVGTVGAFIISLGFYPPKPIALAKFRKELNLTQLSDTSERWVMGIGEFGLAARGVVFCVIGFFIIQAARQSDPSEARTW